MSIDDSDSRLNNSIILSLRYLSSDMSYTFNLCQYSKISTPTTVGSMVFTIKMSKFDNYESNTLALACSLSRVDIIPDGA